MIARAVGFLFSLTVAGLAAFVSSEASKLYTREFKDWPPIPNFEQTYAYVFAAFGLLVGFTVSSLIYRQALGLFEDILSDLRRIPGRDKAAVILGVFIGLGMTTLVGLLVIRIPRFGPHLVVLLGMVCVYIGVAITLSMKEELYFFFPGLASRGSSAEGEASGRPPAQPKLLDTNVIIDGRIADIARAGFIEGPILVPAFVLDELHLIADSSDTLKRNRGRRGLDILNQMQQAEGLEVRVLDHYARPAGDARGAAPLGPAGERGMDSQAREGGGAYGAGPVDAKLVQLAKELGGAIITNDFNLNKVAQLQGIRVLNVNELANAVKPVVLPGEDLSVTIVREGKEPDQGVAYLDDGTMVVVEHGKDRIGQTLRIVVTSVLQTVAGKMIFGNPEAGAEHSRAASAASEQARARPAPGSSPPNAGSRATSPGGGKRGQSPRLS